MHQTDELCVYQSEQFGNIMFAADFAALVRAGIHPGDSVDVCFADGRILEDIPFLSGCILPAGMICMNAHEGFDWIRIEKRFGNAWKHFRMAEPGTGRIVLREPGKYQALYQVFNAEFSLAREDYPSDEYFANYRPLCCSSLRERTLYRSVSSFEAVNDGTPFPERLQCIDRLMERDGIRTVIHMTCDRKQLKAYFDSGRYDGCYIKKLYEEGRVYADCFSVDYASSAFLKSLVSALRVLLTQEGPFLIQCRAGLDRTGFLCSLLEALAGASEEEIIDDYMRSYACLCGITRENHPEKYEMLKKQQADVMLNTLKQGKAEAGPAAAAEAYLKQCMSPAEISELKHFLTESAR